MEMRAEATGRSAGGDQPRVGPFGEPGSVGLAFFVASESNSVAAPASPSWLELLPDAGIALDEHGCIQAINTATEELFGYSPQAAQGREVRALLPGLDPATIKPDFAIDRKIHWGEYSACHQDGSTFPVEVRSAPLEATGPWRIGLVIRDLTQRKVWQEQVLAAQRMQAVGRLAGGIAHDFNNFLTVFSCNIELMNEALRRGPAVDPMLPAALEQIQKAWRGASGLTRQLLNFSRRDAVRPTLLDVDQVLGDMERMLHPLLGEHIRIQVTRRCDLGQVRMDSGHLEQVIMNLAVNARDAMPEGGTLRIHTSVEPWPASSDAREAHSGTASICIAVSDTGTGMDADVLDRVFDPFFTTKPAGKGTGLGLATVSDIVKQAGGRIRAESAPGRGTTIRVFLPIAGSARPAAAAPVSEADAPGGRETVLICEDDPMIIRLTSQILTARGYRVLAAQLPQEAIALAAAHQGPIHLLVADTIMPEMSGPRLAELLVQERPELNVLFVSGYTSDVLGDFGLATESLELLEKPFTPAALLHRVRQVLDSEKPTVATQAAPPTRPVRVPPARS